MSSDSGFTPAGSSTYSSGTMYVGDGTWDSQRNTFLLPNLMGLNFATMQYNGMGNRFKEMTGYHPLIRAHGIIASIVFLGLVPAAILIARFYSPRPAWALRMHIWLQVLTLFLSTVVFILGWFAVGPQRSLTNPHHGIGLAIYVMVIFQTLWGWFVHKMERGRRRLYLPLKLMIHQWLGRALAILGIIQIPLGLTLYGSPAVLFILFTLAAFTLFVTFFILTYLHERRRGAADYDIRGSYVSNPEVIEERRHSHSRLGRLAAVGAAGAGLAALGSRLRGRSRSHSRVEYESEAQTSYIDDKYSEDHRRRGGFGDKLLKLAAIGGGIALVKKLFDRRRDDESDAGSGRYRPAHARTDSMTEESLSRIEEGRPPTRPPLNRPPTGPLPPAGAPTHDDSVSYTSYLTNDDDRGGGHPVRNALLGAGALFGLKEWLKNRRERKEQKRVEDLRHQELEEEKIARANSRRKYTGDGTLPPPRIGRQSSFTSTDYSSDITPRPHPNRPLGPDSVYSGEPVVSGAVQPPPHDIPPIPPAHSTSDIYHGSQHHLAGDAAAAGLAGAAAGVASGHHRRRSSRSRSRREQVASPPVSVKVKMHDDGRHVTLRRLTEQEAAASREARRRDRERRSSRRRHGSVSSLSGNEESDRWRRVEEIERRQAEQVQMEQAAAQAAAAPIPVSEAGPVPSAVPSAPYGAGPSNLSVPHNPSLPTGVGSITSPGTYTGTETGSDYVNNRRRRRAERAQARLARQQAHGVEFT